MGFLEVFSSRRSFRSGIEPLCLMSPALTGRFFTTNATWEAQVSYTYTSVQSLSHVWLFKTPWTAAHQASLSITNSWSLLKTHVHRLSDAIQSSHLLSSPFPPTINLSQHQGLFKWVSSSHRVAKVHLFPFFLDSHVRDIIQYFSFSVWLTSLSVTISKYWINNFETSLTYI